MGTAELFILAVGLSMDAFAVSVCKGLSLGKINIGSIWELQAHGLEDFRR